MIVFVVTVNRCDYISAPSVLGVFLKQEDAQRFKNDLDKIIHSSVSITENKVLS